MIRVCVLLVLLASASSGALLGSNKCTWGPSYWCKSFKSADECGATNHCRQNVWTKSSSFVAVVGDSSSAQVDVSDACTFCKDMVSDIKNFLEKNETQAVILQYWNRACDFLPDQYSRQECIKIEQHYLDEFLQLVKDDVDPDTICSVASLCGNGKTTTTQAPPTKSAKISRVSLTKTGEHDAPLCEACKAFMALLSNEIKDQKNQDAAKNFLLNECKQLGGDFAQECQALVNSYLPEVFTLLEQELNEDACKLAQLCPSNSTAALAAAAQSSLAKWLKNSSLRTQLKGMALRLGDEECDVCEEAIGFAKIFLSNNATEQELIQLIENDICSQLGDYSSMCNTAVEDYLPVIWARLTSYLDPATICTELGLCTSASKAPKQRAKASPTCIICEFVMSKLEDTLIKNATEAEIIEAVEKVCSILPSSVKSECDQLIEKYGPAIIQLLIHDASPSVICGFLGLCASGDSLYKAPLKQDNCMMCELAMSYAQSMLEKNATQTEIEQVLEKVCNYLSGTIAQECNTMVETYTPQILKMIADNINPKDICTRLGMCKSMKVDGLVHLYHSSDNS